MTMLLSTMQREFSITFIKRQAFKTTIVSHRSTDHYSAQLLPRKLSLSHLQLLVAGFIIYLNFKTPKRFHLSFASPLKIR